jgi:hypothetical protein
VSASPESTKPILTAALLCDNVLQEKDDTLSAIRIIDKVIVDIPKPPEELQGISNVLIPAVVRLKLLVCIKAGDFRGHVTVQMRIVATTGRPGKVIQIGEADFTRAEEGFNGITELGLSIKRLGVAWIEVIVNDEVRSRIPLTIHLAEGSEPLPEQPPDSPGTE